MNKCVGIKTEIRHVWLSGCIN